MSVPSNGPLVYDGSPYQHEVKTLLQLRNSLMIRLGFAAQLSAPPAGMEILLNDFLIDAQTQMYERYSPLRNNIWWRIPVTQGNRHYEIPSISTGPQTDIAFSDNAPSVDTITRVTGSFIADGFAPGQVVSISGSAGNSSTSIVIAAITDLAIVCTAAGSLVTEAAGPSITLNTITYKALNARKVTEQWVLDGSTWNIMREGITTARLNETGQSYPQEYEWTDHLVIWPEPDKDYTIYVKGHFGLLPFAVDTDVTTIDHKLVFLHALANAKTHYGQSDAGTYYRQLEVFLQKLNSGEFGQKRFIPSTSNSRKESIALKPKGTWR